MPKAQDGWVEQVRALLAARQACVRSYVSCANSARGMLVTAPESVRERYRGMGTAEMMRCLRRKRSYADPALQAVHDALQSLASVWHEAKAASEELEDRIAGIIAENAPRARRDLRLRPDIGGPPRHRGRRQPGAHPERGGVREPLRGSPHRGLQRQDDAAQAEQGR